MIPEQNSLAARVGEIMSAAGIDNFHLDGGILVMCGTRYAIEQCRCSDPGCNGLRLRREGGGEEGRSFALQ
ncbi:MAG: hypothetical protein AB7D33_14795 [Sphingobium sp.]